MRAREFISENTHRRLDFTDPSLQNANVMAGMDQYYRFYRLSLDMAQLGADGKVENPELSKPIEDSPVLVGYTDVEQKMIDTVAKLRGIKVNKSSKGNSKELEGTNSVSPVAKFKPTKRKS